VSTAPRNQEVRTGPLVIGEDLFRGVLVRERKRADRSNQPLAVILVALRADAGTASVSTWEAVVDALLAAKRETDVLGWFEQYGVLGLMLPEVAGSSPAFPDELNDRFRRELFRRLDAQTAMSVVIRLLMHPASGTAEAEEVDRIVSAVGLGPKRQKHYDTVKRALDVVLSLMLLLVLSPLFFLIAAFVKFTSPGPVLFRQKRIGQMMKPFTMLKFRTMHVNADHAIHHKFVSSFIKSRGRSEETAKTGLFKIVNDPRVTMMGRILRRTSLDELPQLWNVFRGEMSLVGPRPPLPYEVEQYMSWHRRRVLEAKPGLTGLWQVTGRSRTTFDEMVRLDLRYVRTCSIWTDIKILLATPRAVISGKGAC
jgi:exopolysaccharide biosynthesis polyprenyl glycosylphosphotransferase